MEFYELLKIIAVTKSCKLKAKSLLKDSELFLEHDLATLCNYYSALNGLEKVFNDYFFFNSQKINKKIEDKEFLTDLLSFIKACSLLEEEVSQFVSMEMN